VIDNMAKYSIVYPKKAGGQSVSYITAKNWKDAVIKFQKKTGIRRVLSTKRISR
jgi:hypothetical protein